MHTKRKITRMLIYCLGGTPTCNSAQKGVAIKLFAQEAAHESKSPSTGDSFEVRVTACTHNKQVGVPFRPSSRAVVL